VFSEYKRELHDGLLTNISGVNIVDINLVNPTSRGDIPDNTQMIEVLYAVPPNNEITSATFNLVSPLFLTEETNL
jgi:hypothetical protein